MHEELTYLMPIFSSNRNQVTNLQRIPINVDINVNKSCFVGYFMLLKDGFLILLIILRKFEGIN